MANHNPQQAPNRPAPLAASTSTKDQAFPETATPTQNIIVLDDVTRALNDQANRRMFPEGIDDEAEKDDSNSDDIPYGFPRTITEGGREFEVRCIRIDPEHVATDPRNAYGLTPIRQGDSRFREIQGPWNAAGYLMQRGSVVCAIPTERLKAFKRRRQSEGMDLSCKSLEYIEKRPKRVLPNGQTIVGKTAQGLEAMDGQGSVIGGSKVKPEGM